MWPFTDPTMLYCDNQSAISLSKDRQYHTRMKHINMHFHFIHEAVEDGTVSLVYCLVDSMTADVFTKPLSCPKTETHHVTLRLLPA